ncbi:hypothetical protein P7H62_13120 [Vagococcus carniphilus]|uniref:hypothetical protein n=1 Tax=Vagococcus carniphilus TaxID=218144 RepID=UPI00288E2991|nr:hypothetical protein [Vagococcus carniphilus]MDT2831890.1 hypothetical protein [Vagococcus carniphilus]MDT2839302.1 hypothetical protein [Vagococcus carniphilus]MDT2855400.1 hypothetical protein [Vagococcus carniphilus]
MKRKYNSVLNKIENELQLDEPKDFVRHVYEKLVFEDMSTEELREILSLDSEGLKQKAKEIDHLVDLKMEQLSFKEIDKRTIEWLRKNYYIKGVTRK